MFGIKRRRAARLAAQEAERQRIRDMYTNAMVRAVTAPRPVRSNPALGAPYGTPRATREDDSSSDLLTTVVAAELASSFFDSSSVSDTSSSFDSSSSSDFSGGGGDFGGGGSSSDW